MVPVGWLRLEDGRTRDPAGIVLANSPLAQDVPNLSGTETVRLGGDSHEFSTGSAAGATGSSRLRPSPALPRGDHQPPTPAARRASGPVRLVTPFRRARQMRNSRPLSAGSALLAAAAVLLGSAGLVAQCTAQHDTISSQADFLTRLKRVELGRDGGFWVGLSGHVQVRTEG